MCGPSVNNKWAFMARCAFPISLLFSLGLVVLVCFPRSVMAEWSAMTGSKVSYTDDVTNFSAARRLKLSQDPSQPTGLPTQLSDVFWDPSLEVIRSFSSMLGPNELFIKAHHRQGLWPPECLPILLPNLQCSKHIYRKTSGQLSLGFITHYLFV